MCKLKVGLTEMPSKPTPILSPVFDISQIYDPQKLVLGFKNRLAIEMPESRSPGQDRVLEIRQRPCPSREEKRPQGFGSRKS